MINSLAPKLRAAAGRPAGGRRDALQLTFRRLRASERQKLAEHLLRLPRADRHMRFCALIGDEAVRAYCAGMDWRRTIVLACFAEGAICGAAELLRIDEAVPATAELALSVAGPFQNRGIGTELTRRALVLARNRFIGSVHMIFLHENARMRHIARKFGAELRVREGEVHGHLIALWPSYLSMINEAAYEAEALLGAVFSTRAAGFTAADRWPPAA